MGNRTKILIGLGNEIKKGISPNLCKGDVSRMYLDFLNKKYNMDEWHHISNINSYVAEKNDIILIKPVKCISQNSGMVIKNILHYLNCKDLKNVCIIVPDMYRLVGKFKYKNYTKIYKKLGADFYNILNADIINNLLNNNFLQLCIGVNNLPNERKFNITTTFQECINEHEHKIFLKIFQLADEYFSKKIMNSKVITTNHIHFKEKYPAMEPQKSFKRSTAKRRYILDVYRHMYK
ncbi:hypothetical protein, conserved [Plasmodium gonderi]|uniref:Uncharacterized protein n=1 Tax=Plasmodium gonderi TaxID=77519 RepID=A0A1Y1JH90_PLAGO|nr:hypothetical protein, conserved [Plasmodium gonderi]GAW81899.1 hypothetical protein, conserved [Plasmodium gonderi]